MNKEGKRHDDKRSGGSPKRQKIDGRERHFSSANLQRQEIVAEAGLRRGCKDQKDHQRAVKHGERGVTLRSGAETGKKRNLHGRPDEMDAHQQRKEHSKENAAQGKPEVAQTDHLVTSVEERAGEKTGRWHFRSRAAAVVVSDHAGSHYTPAGLKLEIGRAHV